MFVQVTVGDLKAAACKALKLEEVDVEMWDYYERAYYSNLELRLTEDLKTANLLENQLIMLNEKASCQPSSQTRRAHARHDHIAEDSFDIVC